LILAVVPLAVIGVALIAVTGWQLRTERQARRDNALDQTAAQIADRIKTWGESARLAGLIADVNGVDSDRGLRVLNTLLARFPDMASAQLFDAAGRRVLERRRPGVLSLPELNLESAALRGRVQRDRVWMAPMHVQNEASPRLPFAVAISDGDRLRGFLILEFQTSAIDVLLARAPFSMTILATPDGRTVRAGGAHAPFRTIDNVGLILALRADGHGVSAAWIVAGMIFILMGVVLVTGFLERHWSRRAADDIAHRERLVTIGTTASAIGHELRTALAVIRNAVEALKIRADVSTPNAAKHVEAIENQIRLGNRLLSDLLEFARPRSAVRKADNINPLIQDVLATLSLPRSIRVESHLSDALPLLSLDADKMRQVLSNLVLNAADAMPEGGRLNIATRPSGTAVLVEIRDDGAGMPADVHRRLFEPFFSTKARGMGLGLSIVKKIVDAHEGEIRIESAAGHGTTVTLLFPALKSEMPAVAAIEQVAS
jgi:signal transduction histidine kinase